MTIAFSAGATVVIVGVGVVVVVVMAAGVKECRRKLNALQV